jgi:hypothetical protein
MLPAPATSTARPDKKKLSLFFPGISSSDAENDGVNGAGAGDSNAGNLSPAPPTPVNAKQVQRRQMIRDGIIIFISLVLSVAFLVFGPAGDFIAGRAFTITTTNQVTYIYYNWTIQLPLSTPTLNMQAHNNRLVGSVLLAPAPSTDNHYTVSIETTVRNGPFTFTPWTMYEAQESGFTVDISDLLPNTYNIDYANIIVYMPSGRHYSSLIWNTYPIPAGYATLPSRKWNVAFNNLTEAGIQFDKIRILTDGGGISSKGVRASEGYFQTLAGPITGEYTIPPSRLTFNTSGGEPFSDK